MKLRATSVENSRGTRPGGVLGVLALASILVACAHRNPDSRTGAETPGFGPPGTEIDRFSYDLGSVGAFAEMVAAGVKTLALGPPLPHAEMERLYAAARPIAEEHGVILLRDADFLVTDLFAESLTAGKEVLVIGSEQALAAYAELKAKKAALVDAGTYRGQARATIAREMGRLLSYPEWKIAAELGDGTR